jgi:hypothetical protein
MMDREEVLRRLRAYLSMLPDDRPLGFKRLAQACDEEPSNLYRLASGTRPLTERMARKIARVLKLVEEGRIAYVCDVNKRGKGRFIIAEGVPQPCAIRRVLLISGRGPRLVQEIVNPNTFPSAPPLFRKSA